MNRYSLEKVDEGQSDDGYIEYYQVVDCQKRTVATIHHQDFEWEEYEQHAKIIVDALNDAAKGAGHES